MGTLMSRRKTRLQSLSFVRLLPPPSFDRGTILSSRPVRSQSPSRATAVKDGPVFGASALAARSVLEGREHEATLDRLGNY
jgi:hypothetical protein